MSASSSVQIRIQVQVQVQVRFRFNVLNKEIEIWSSLVWFCFGRSDRGRGLVQVRVWSRSRSGRWSGPAAGREAQLLSVLVQVLDR